MKLSDELLDRAVNALRFVIPDPRQCLQSAFLLSRVLDAVARGHGFVLKLGSLHVIPEDQNHPEGPSIFDPREWPRGADGSLPPEAGFHAWLERRDGTLLEPSILLTLAGDGYDVRGDGYFTCGGRRTKLEGLWFVYEPLPDLQLVGVGPSEPHLALALKLALTGPSPGLHRDALGPNYLDVKWRA